MHKGRFFGIGRYGSSRHTRRACRCMRGFFVVRPWRAGLLKRTGFRRVLIPGTGKYPRAFVLECGIRSPSCPPSQDKALLLLPQCCRSLLPLARHPRNPGWAEAARAGALTVMSGARLLWVSLSQLSSFFLCTREETGSRPAASATRPACLMT